MQLGWQDLMISQVSEAELGEFMAWFGPVVPQGSTCRSVFFNRVGEWFVQTSDLAVRKVSNLTGTASLVASTFERFTAMVNSQPWQEANLWSREIVGWKSAGIALEAGQVYAFVPHPAANAGVIAERVMPMDLRMWLWISAQSLGLVR